jgi:hypothetical protein
MLQQQQQQAKQSLGCNLSCPASTASPPMCLTHAANTLKHPIFASTFLSMPHFSLPLQLREAAWLAAGQHGFAALAGLPELQQLLPHTLLPLLEQLCELDAETHCAGGQGAELLERRCLHEETPLLPHLSPPLLTCLLAEVAVGLLVPG